MEVGRGMVGGGGGGGGKRQEGEHCCCKRSQDELSELSELSERHHVIIMVWARCEFQQAYEASQMSGQDNAFTGE